VNSRRIVANRRVMMSVPTCSRAYTDQALVSNSLSANVPRGTLDVVFDGCEARFDGGDEERECRSGARPGFDEQVAGRRAG